MSKTRPYEYVPTYAIAILIEEYERLIKVGFFRLQNDLEKMKAEMQLRFSQPEEDRQITIEEYMRSRKNESNRFIK